MTIARQTGEMTYSNARICNAAITFTESFHVLANCRNRADNFVTGYQLQMKARTSLDPMDEYQTYWEFRDELSFVDMTISSTDTWWELTCGRNDTFCDVPQHVTDVPD